MADRAGTEASGRTGRSTRLTRRQLATWRSFVEVSAELTGRIGADLLAETALSPGDYTVLLALSEAEGDTLRASELAATIGWERSRLSHHMRRMESRGLIARAECLTDTRGAEVSRTDAGERAFRRATLPHFRSIKRLFADALDAEQLDALDGITDSLARHLHPEPEAAPRSRRP